MSITFLCMVLNKDTHDIYFCFYYHDRLQFFFIRPKRGVHFALALWYNSL